MKKTSEAVLKKNIEEFIKEFPTGQNDHHFAAIVAQLDRFSATYEATGDNVMLGDEFGTLDSEIIMTKEFNSIIYNHFADISLRRGTSDEDGKRERNWYVSIAALVLSLEENGFAFHSEYWYDSNNKGNVRFINDDTKTVVSIHLDVSTNSSHDLATPENTKFYEKLYQEIKEAEAKLQVEGGTKEKYEKIQEKFEKIVREYKDKYYPVIYGINEIDVFSATMTAYDVETWLSELVTYPRLYQYPTNIKSISKVVQHYIGFDTVNQVYCIRDREVKIPEVDNNLFNLNYDMNMGLYTDDIIDFMENNTNGLLLLHGIPGTGKTQFTNRLSYLLSRKEITTLFIPASLVKNFGDVKFTQYLEEYLQNLECMVVIEDAEAILKSRDKSDIEASGITSHILNMIDGTLGGKKSFVLATFNTDLENIDEAMLRAGRLIDRVELGKLSVDRANALAEHIGAQARFDSPTTVAEVWQALKNENNNLERRDAVYQGLETGSESSRYEFPNSLSTGSGE